MPESSVSQQEWDIYAQSHPRTSIYHMWSWTQHSTDAFSFPVHRLVERGPQGLVSGILPLVLQRSRLLGNRLVSLPFFNYGGPVGDTPAIEERLLARAAELGRELGARTVEIRDALPRPGLLNRTDKVTLELALPPDLQALGAMLGAKLRSQIRRCDREAPRVATGGIELVSDFYQVFAHTMRDLGTPVLPQAFFVLLLKRMQTDCSVVVVYLRDRPAACALLTHFRDRTEIPWAASLGALRATGVNMRLYWECLSLAVTRGCATFDFGRSTRDSGPFRFKTQWGAVPRQLYWVYPGEPADSTTESGSSRLMSSLQKAWTRLPVPVANRLGPLFSSGLPW